jgi:hypothetical protein
VPEIAGSWIGRAPIVVSEVTTGDHSECANNRQGARLGAAQRVLAIAVVSELPVSPARQMDVAAEGIPRLAIALSSVPIAVGPAGIVVAVWRVAVRALPFAAGTAAE